MTLPENDDCSSNSPPHKRIKLGETSRADSPCIIGLLNCCDDILLEIFSYLRPQDLLALSKCCQRLHQIVFDRTLWISVDFRPTPLSHLELDEYVKFLLPATNLIATTGPGITSLTAGRPVRQNSRGDRSHANSQPESSNPNVNAVTSSSTSEVGPSFTAELLKRIKEASPKLVTLILENHILDAEDISWEDFPTGIEFLNFRGCHMLKYQSSKSFFFGIDKCMPQLKALNLSGCRWFESHSFLALSKCPVLEELRLADCRIQDFVPYISLGTRFGFNTLTVIDLRRTWVCDREISCLNKTATLQELYLESPGGEFGGRLVTDLAVTSFGSSMEDWNAMGYFVVLMAHYEGVMPSALRVIELCNYTLVTDTSLRHCASCLKGLRLLNIKGTSCTEKGVIAFKTQRSDIEIVSDFNLEALD